MPINLTPIARIVEEPSISTKGSFIAGTTGVFFFTFADITGNLFNPTNVDITILDSDGAVAKTSTSADWLELGQYAYSWNIPSDQTPGLYTILVEYVSQQADGASEDFINEAFYVKEVDSTVIDPAVIAYRSLVESLIGYTQRIPIHHEIGRLNNTRSTAKFSFPRWNQPAGALVFVNGNQKDLGDGYEVDFRTGEITFSSILSEYDEVRASYSFRWFTDEELDNFVATAVDIFNQYPPHTVYNVGTLSTRYARAGSTIVQQAAVFALRRLIMDLHFQELPKIMGGMDRADRLMGSLGDLKQNYEEEITKLYEQKAKGPYIGLTKTITVPEFTLPGGRSRWFRYLFKGAMILLPLLLIV